MRGSQAGREEGELRRPVRALAQPPRLCLARLPSARLLPAHASSHPTHLELVVASPPCLLLALCGRCPSQWGRTLACYPASWKTQVCWQAPKRGSSRPPLASVFAVLLLGKS